MEDFMMSSKPVRRAIVVVDLSRYTEIVHSIEVGQKMGPQATRFLQGQIQELIRRAVEIIGIDFRRCFIKGTGDGAILQFDSAIAAERFAVVLHEISHAEHCKKAARDVERRSFRVGICTGDVILVPHDICGLAVSYATRMEQAARTGQIVIDIDSWARLPAERQTSYGPIEVLQIKSHDQAFEARRCAVVERAPWDKDQKGPHPKEKTVWYLPDRDRNPHFIGRQNEIELLRDQLKTGRIAAVTESRDISSARRITALVGLGGIGKTQTAVEYAFQHAHDYKYVFFLHADDPSKIKRDYACIAERLRLSPWEKGPEGLIEVVLEWMKQNSEWLLIVDNVDRPDDVAPYLPKNSKGHILVTSRLQTLDPLALGVITPIAIGLFTHEESRALLLGLTGRTTEGNAEEEDAVSQLAHGMGGLPVALEQAATYIRNLPCTFADYWHEFNLRRTELFADQLARPFHHEGIVIADRDKAIATTWDINFRRVQLEASQQKGAPQSAAPELLLVSAFLSPDDIPMELLASGASELGPHVAKALRGDGGLRVQTALHLLHKYALIEIKLETHAYRMHRLVQEVVRKWWMTENQRIIWAKRVIGVLRRGTRSLHASEGNWPSALKDRHFAGFVATILMDEWKQNDFEFEEAAEVLSQTGFLETKSGRNNEAAKFLERALGIRQKLFGPNHLKVAETLSHLANNLAEWNRVREAFQYYERALKIRLQEQGQDDQDVAQVYNDLGIANFSISRYDEAEKHYREALRIWSKHREGNLIGSAMFNLAMIYQTRKPLNADMAEAHFRGALSNVTKPHMRAQVCRLYGAFLGNLGRNAEALPLLREGRNLAKETFGDYSERVLPCNDSLSPVLRYLGLVKEAEDIERESNEIRKRLAQVQSHPLAAQP
ncbi:tetratricopeptide repeat protein [Candidatus Sumerlaeota bacterium]|nr:tetratricopeptide repeat protein [Candidatus Sumerlaeota bacterium]